MNKKVGLALIALLLLIIVALAWSIAQRSSLNSHDRITAKTAETVSYETFKADLDARIDALKENERQYVLNLDVLSEMDPNAPVYCVVLKNTYADLFEVSLTAYFVDNDFQTSVFAFLGSESNADANAAVSPIVLLAEAQEAGTNAAGFLLFSRYRMILKKESMSESVQRSMAGIEKNGETFFTDHGTQFAAADELLFFAEAAGE